MQMSVRWVGAGGPVRLAHGGTIPGVVSALHAIAPGVAWSRERVDLLVDRRSAIGRGAGS